MKPILWAYRRGALGKEDQRISRGGLILSAMPLAKGRITSGMTTGALLEVVFALPCRNPKSPVR
jgi:hypothetical protein